MTWFLDKINLSDILNSNTALWIHYFLLKKNIIAYIVILVKNLLPHECGSFWVNVNKIFFSKIWSFELDNQHLTLEHQAWTWIHVQRSLGLLNWKSWADLWILVRLGLLVCLRRWRMSNQWQAMTPGCEDCVLLGFRDLGSQYIFRRSRTSVFILGDLGSQRKSHVDFPISILC